MTDRAIPPQDSLAQVLASASDPAATHDAGSAADLLVSTGTALLLGVLQRASDEYYTQGRADVVAVMRDRAVTQLTAEPTADPKIALNNAIETMELAVGGLRLAAAGLNGSSAAARAPSSLYVAATLALWSAATASERVVRERAALVEEPEYVGRRIAAAEALLREADQRIAELREIMESPS